jgi:hypothetical protein
MLTLLHEWLGYFKLWSLVSLTLNQLKVDITITNLRPHNNILSFFEYLPIITDLLLPLPQSLPLLLTACLLSLGRVPAWWMSTRGLLLFDSSWGIVRGLVLSHFLVRKVQFWEFMHNLELLHIDQVFLWLLDSCLDIDAWDLERLFRVRRVRDWRYSARLLVHNGWNIVCLKGLIEVAILILVKVYRLGIQLLWHVLNNLKLVRGRERHYLKRRSGRHVFLGRFSITLIRQQMLVLITCTFHLPICAWPKTTSDTSSRCRLWYNHWILMAITPLPYITSPVIWYRFFIASWSNKHSSLSLNVCIF